MSEARSTAELYGSWVDLTHQTRSVDNKIDGRQTSAESRAENTPPEHRDGNMDFARATESARLSVENNVPLGGESDYLRMLHEAQVESRMRFNSSNSNSSGQASGATELLPSGHGDRYRPPYLVQAYYLNGTGVMYDAHKSKTSTTCNSSSLISPKSPPNSPHREDEIRCALGECVDLFAAECGDADNAWIDRKFHASQVVVNKEADSMLNTFSVPPYRHSGASSRQQCTSPPVMIHRVLDSESLWDWSSRPNLPAHNRMGSRQRSTSSHALSHHKTIDESEEQAREDGDGGESRSDVARRAAHTDKVHRPSRSQPYTPCHTPPRVWGGGGGVVALTHQSRASTACQRRGAAPVDGGIWHRFDSRSSFVVGSRPLRQDGGERYSSLEQLIPRSRHQSKCSETTSLDSYGWVRAPAYFFAKEDVEGDEWDHVMWDGKEEGLSHPLVAKGGPLAVTKDPQGGHLAAHQEVSCGGSDEERWSFWYTVALTNVVSLVLGFGFGFWMFRRASLLRQTA